MICPSYEVILPGLQQLELISQFGQEYLLYFSHTGERKVAVIKSNDKRFMRIERMIIDFIEIEDILIDFSQHKVKFRCNEPIGTTYIQYILEGLLIQNHERSFGFFTYYRRKK